MLLRNQPPGVTSKLRKYSFVSFFSWQSPCKLKRYHSPSHQATSFLEKEPQHSFLQKNCLEQTRNENQIYFYFFLGLLRDPMKGHDPIPGE